MAKSTDKTKERRSVCIEGGRNVEEELKAEEGRVVGLANADDGKYSGQSMFNMSW